MLELNKAFLIEWSTYYDGKYLGGNDEKAEKDVRDWLSKLPTPKYLDREHFIILGIWKTARQTQNYQKNDEQKVLRVTKAAYEATSTREKLDILKELNGVSLTVGATILHFFLPNDYPIYDFHARATLKEAGLWGLEDKDSLNVPAYEEYIDIMKRLAAKNGLTLRQVDKALFAYDKWGDKTGKESSKLGESKCSFCERTITDNKEIKQGLCGDCYDLRRVVKRLVIKAYS